MQQRTWVRSGISEDFDKRQQRLLDLVHSKIVYYYRELYQTKLCYAYPLSLARLAKLCKRSGASVAMAVRVLANTVTPGVSEPVITYDRQNSLKNKSHRPYRIFLRCQEPHAGGTFGS